MSPCIKQRHITSHHIIKHAVICLDVTGARYRVQPGHGISDIMVCLSYADMPAHTLYTYRIMYIFAAYTSVNIYVYIGMGVWVCGHLLLLCSASVFTRLVACRFIFMFMLASSCSHKT